MRSIGGFTVTTPVIIWNKNFKMKFYIHPATAAAITATGYVLPDCVVVSGELPKLARPSEEWLINPAQFRKTPKKQKMNKREKKRGFHL